MRCTAERMRSALAHVDPETEWYMPGCLDDWLPRLDVRGHLARPYDPAASLLPVRPSESDVAALSAAGFRLAEAASYGGLFLERDLPGGGCARAEVRADWPRLTACWYGRNWDAPSRALQWKHDGASSSLTALLREAEDFGRRIQSAASSLLLPDQWILHAALSASSAALPAVPGHEYTGVLFPPDQYLALALENGFRLYADESSGLVLIGEDPDGVPPVRIPFSDPPRDLPQMLSRFAPARRAVQWRNHQLAAAPGDALLSYAVRLRQRLERLDSLCQCLE